LNGLDTFQKIGVHVTPERPQNLKSDDFIQDAGLSRTGRVARKSSMERLLGKYMSKMLKFLQLEIEKIFKVTNQWLCRK